MRPFLICTADVNVARWVEAGAGPEDDDGGDDDVEEVDYRRHQAAGLRLRQQIQSRTWPLRGGSTCS
jgi:hypothetical protein